MRPFLLASHALYRACTHAPAAQVSTVRIVYIRHGESEWNDVFNKGLGPVRSPFFLSFHFVLGRSPLL